MPYEATGVMADWFKKMFGGVPAHEENITTVGVARIQVLPNNPERTSVVFVNVSADFITITPTTQIPVGGGIRIAPNGGFISMTLQDDAPLQSMSWFAAADSPARDLYTVETMRIGIKATEG